jgi:hypothetical protein
VLALHFNNCGEAFIKKHELDIYLNYHTGKRLYTCRIDGWKKTFPDPNSRLCHDFGIAESMPCKARHAPGFDSGKAQVFARIKVLPGS